MSAPTHWSDQHGLKVLQEQRVSSHQTANTIRLVQEVAKCVAEHGLREIEVEREAVKVRVKA